MTRPTVKTLQPGAFRGTGSLVRLGLRRDRLIIPVWSVLMVLFVAGTASSFAGLYPTAADQAKAAATLSANTAFDAIYGPVLAPNLGALVAWRTLTSTGILAGILSLVLAVRHTRGEEEAGRAELVGAAVVGRQAMPLAALIVVVIANLVLAVFVAGSLIGTGLPVAGSVAQAASGALTGIVFGSVALVFAQTASTGRAAAGAAGAVLGLTYVLRVAGDAGAKWLVWTSPFGWMQKVRPFAGENWSMLAVPAVAAIVLLGAAAILVARRDHGGGLLAERRGPASGSPALGTPFGLAWRLQRGSLLTWTLAFVAVGATVGALAGQVGALADTSGQFADVINRLGGSQSLIDNFLAGIIALYGLITAGYMVAAVLRVHGEEDSGRAEPVLATATSRVAWAGSHLLVAVIGTIVLQFTTGFFVGLVHGLREGDVGGQLPRLLEVALLQLPSIWVLGGLTLAVVGLLPRLTSLAWGVFAVCALLLEVGEFADVPRALLNLSPFAHAPLFPVDTPDYGTLFGLVAVTAVLVAAGLAGLRRRDLT
jgi:ABC-2 type transport system permease protein